MVIVINFSCLIVPHRMPREPQDDAAADDDDDNYDVGVETVALRVRPSATTSINRTQEEDEMKKKPR